MKKLGKELHIPVLFKELTSAVKIAKNKRNIIIDCTLWLGWHAKEMIQKMNYWDIFVWFDADIRNMELAKKNLEWVWNDIEKIFINSNFVNLKNELQKVWIEKITWIYYDLWISSLHVDDSERWFSFKLDWPLDMRFDTNTYPDARFILNNYSKEDLIKIFREYWEEPASTKIATKIVEKRKTWFKFLRTSDLASLIDENVSFPKTKNRIFQAIRIEVNKEIENVEKSLKDAISLLETEWIIFVISFHSLEDRVVKNTFRNESKDCICRDMPCSCKHKKQVKILNKDIILPSEKEIKLNHRSRSAKARIAEKI